MMGSRPTIEDRIREALSERFGSTSALLDTFLAESTNARELVILACSRLDALANLAVLETTQQKRFISFMNRYSAKGADLALVAVPNLYSYLSRHYDTVSATIREPGRLRLYDPIIDRPLLQFVVDSKLPITSEDVERFLEYFSRVVQRRYRTTATQSRAKPVLEDEDQLHRYLLRESGRYRRGRYLDAARAMRPLLRDFTIGALLYREYRSGAIHEFGFGVDDRFFQETTLYVSTRRHLLEDTLYLEVRVPARWLIGAYKTSLSRYQAQLVRSRKLPIGLYLEVCDVLEEFEYLDESSVGEGRELRLSVGR